jgi:hypothetical protein
VIYMYLLSSIFENTNMMSWALLTEFVGCLCWFLALLTEFVSCLYWSCLCWSLTPVIWGKQLTVELI